MDILDQMEAWRKNARFISEQDFFSRMMFEIRTNRNKIERLQEALLRIQNILREGAPWFPKAIMIAHEIDSALNPTVYELGNIEVDGQPTEQEEWRDFDPDC